ncbi:MAG: flagellar basal body protein [Pseudomonadota bacterium]
MGINALGAGHSGLNANQQALNVEGHSIANMSTAGFRPQRAQFNEANPAGSGVTLSVEGRSLAANEDGLDVATSLTNSLTYKAGFELAAQVIKMADERIGTLIDISA